MVADELSLNIVILLDIFGCDYSKMLHYCRKYNRMDVTFTAKSVERWGARGYIAQGYSDSEVKELLRDPYTGETISDYSIAKAREDIKQVKEYKQEMLEAMERLKGEKNGK